MIFTGITKYDTIQLWFDGIQEPERDMRQYYMSTISYIYINLQKATKIWLDDFITELFQTLKKKKYYFYKKHKYKIYI